MELVSFVCGCLFDGDEVYKNIKVNVSNNTISSIQCNTDQLTASKKEHVFDLSDKIIVPGYIDIQVNGGGGMMFNDLPSVSTLKTMVSSHRQFGTTAILPTLITDTNKKMAEAIKAVDSAIDSGVGGILGIHLEGPFLNSMKKGAHDKNKIRALSEEDIHLITSLKGGQTLITLAPENVKPDDLATLVTAKNTFVFAGHSAANYHETVAAINAGITGFTHLFNAMTPLTSREPGMIGAALECDQTYFGIIADGHHVHPTTFKLAVKSKQSGKSILVTDAMAVVGSGNDHFYLNGEKIHSKGGKCVNSAGSLAGSDLDMHTAILNTVAYTGLDIKEAVKMATAYPATMLGIHNKYGFIKLGFHANFTVLNKDLTIHSTVINGDFKKSNLYNKNLSGLDRYSRKKIVSALIAEALNWSN